MSDAGQSTNRIRTRLQTIASWVGLRRQNDADLGEDLLEDALQDEVEFTSLAPISTANPSGQLRSLLSESWIRRHCDPFLYEQACALVESASISLEAVDDERLTCNVCDGDLFSVEIWFENGAISGLCQCDSYRRHKETATSGDQRLACAHIAAVAHYLVSYALIPQSSPGEQAALCPITRQTLDAGHVIYRCSRCHLSYSEEGWQFLKEMDHGKCCGCHGRNCILPLSRDQKVPHAGTIP